MLFAAGLPNLGNGMVDSHKVAVVKMVLMTDFLPNNGSKVWRGQWYAWWK
jgi:hypothetical protein